MNIFMQNTKNGNCVICAVTEDSNLVHHGTKSIAKLIHTVEDYNEVKDLIEKHYVSPYKEMALKDINEGFKINKNIQQYCITDEDGDIFGIYNSHKEATYHKYHDDLEFCFVTEFRKAIKCPKCGEMIVYDGMDYQCDTCGESISNWYDFPEYGDDEE